MSSLSPRASSTASVRYLVLLVASALLIIILMGGLSWFYSASATGYWPGYADMMGDWPSPLAWLRWVIGDISEVAFYKHEFASLGLLFGGALGYWASRYAKTWQGFSISYGTGLWPWLVTSSLLGLALSNALWGWDVDCRHLAANVCRLCVLARRDGVAVWWWLESHPQRSGSRGPAGHTLLPADG